MSYESDINDLHDYTYTIDVMECNHSEFINTAHDRGKFRNRAIVASVLLFFAGLGAKDAIKTKPDANFAVTFLCQLPAGYALEKVVENQIAKKGAENIAIRLEERALSLSEEYQAFPPAWALPEQTLPDQPQNS